MTISIRLRLMLQQFVIALFLMAGLGFGHIESGIAQGNNIPRSKEPKVISPGEITGLFQADIFEDPNAAHDLKHLRTLAVEVTEQSRNKFIGAVKNFGLRHDFKVQIENARHDVSWLQVKLSRKDALIAGGNNDGIAIFRLSFYARGPSTEIASNIQVVQSLFEALRDELLEVSDLRVMQ